MKPEAAASMIEHSLLKADATEEDIRKLCQEAVQYGFYSVCVNPAYIETARKALGHGSGVRITTVVGFPLGAGRREARAAEALDALMHGAQELDIVMNIGAAKSGRWELVREDLASIVRIATGCAGMEATTKVIIEACYLSDEQKLMAAEAAVAAGADYVKTSTGFGPTGAMSGDVAMLKKALAGRARLKAAGGIRDLAAFMSMVEAGADLIGTSSGPLIINQLLAKKG